MNENVPENVRIINEEVSAYLMGILNSMPSETKSCFRADASHSFMEVVMLRAQVHFYREKLGVDEQFFY